MSEVKRVFVWLSALLLSANAAGQGLSASVNLADCANFGTLNIETSYGVTRHLSLSAGAKYNPFTFGHDENAILQRQQTYSAGLKYWVWHVYSGWWLAAKAQYQEFNEGGISSRQTSQGDRYGQSLAVGYSYMLTRHLNIDFGVGMWGGYQTYVVRSCQHCGIIVDEGEKFFLLPNDLTFSLSYIF